MPRLDLNLDNLNQQRQSLLSLQVQLREIDSRVLAQQAELEAALRAGQSANVVAPLKTQLENVRAGRSDLLAQHQALRLDIDRLANGLLAQRDPAQLAEALDGNQPIALLPMRLETRYFSEFQANIPTRPDRFPELQANNPPRPDRLRIRVYPDDINVIQHTAALTETERQAGINYWLARFGLNEAEAERIARDLAVSQGRNRCAWILRILTPTNSDQLGQIEAVPVFPSVEAIAASAKQTRALLLPDRWCAIGYAAGRREVFRVWGKRIPDELLLSPDWLNLKEKSDEAMFAGERAWMVDFVAALDKGMALEVTQEDINVFLRRRQDARGFNLASDTLERLLVVGLEWTKDAAQSAEELAELLAAQRDSAGLGFLPLGTPTNNTELAASGYSRAEESDPPPTPSEHSQFPKEKDALQLLQNALGLPEDKLTAEGIQNAHLAEQRTALHMLNALWRGTFGHYLMELWNPLGSEEAKRYLKTPTLYALRRYAVAYLRPAGALPLLRVGKQPYGVLPVVGKAYAQDNDKLENGIGKVLGVLRPIWEIAVRQKVPLLKDGNVEKAKDILQTNPWSQVAFYRDESPKNPVSTPNNVQSKQDLMNSLLNALGISSKVPGGAPAYVTTPLYRQQFPQDPPYSAIQLAGVPWVLADSQDPTKEAPAATSFAAIPAPANYLRLLADNITKDTVLLSNQSGEALLQALLAYSAYMERYDAVEKYVQFSGAAEKVTSVSAPFLSYVEPRQEDATRFAVNNPLELASVVIPKLTGTATLGQFVTESVNLQKVELQPAKASEMAVGLLDSVSKIIKQVRDLAAVKLSLDYLSQRTVGELNWAFKTTLDAFSYRLDAWFSARANHRLAQLREQNPTGVYVGGFAWVENLHADQRPDSEGHLLAPSLGQAATAAILRSGFMANQEQGAFNIQLDSQRTRHALDILQGLTRDQPLAALYGYRIERGLRDSLLGKLIWPLRLAYPWRPAGADPSKEPKESVGARDVVDGVALLAAWEIDGGVTVRGSLNQVVGDKNRSLAPSTSPSQDEWLIVTQIVQTALDLADSVSDLLMAEGVHQIMQGNFDRAGAAMAIVDKQSLPIEPQVAKTPRGGASYTQRMALLCPGAIDNQWPDDRRSRAEPGLNAWLALMLGEPGLYQFSARVFRGEDADQGPIIDQDPVTVTFQDLGMSPLSAVLSATTVHSQALSGAAETGFRGRLVDTLIAKIDTPTTVTGLDIQQEGVNGGLGLGHFEALATTVRALLDKARPITRKDLVVPDDALEGERNEGEFPGVDEAELRQRADQLIADFTAVKNAVLASVDADDLLNNLAALADFVVPASWPQQVQALQNPSPSADAFLAAMPAITATLALKTQQLAEPIPTEIDKDGAVKPATHGQLVQKSVEQIKLLLGKDFPVLPRVSLGAYAAEFNASLAAQADLTLNNPWQVSGWLPKMARVHDGLDRFVGALSAHEALIGLSGEQDFKLVQYPQKLVQYPTPPKQVWAALPEAWLEDESAEFDPHTVPEELRGYVADELGGAYKNINRVAPKLALALHTLGGLEAVGEDTLLAGLVCDEWVEFIPDRFQTAGISFHYDAPGARPPQSILLALPPTLQQENWQFDQVLDVLHEAWDLAKIRAVRPKDLDGGIGALLPGNYLPQNYSGKLPSVTFRKMAVSALAKFKTSIVPLGKG